MPMFADGAVSEEYNPPRYLRSAVRTTCVLTCLVWLLATAVEAATGPTLFRLFLKDGTALVSFGEFARLDDRVIFSMPLGGTAEQPRVYVATLPSSLVDWTRTDAYATSARSHWYANARGEEEFEQLSADVARVLNEVALLPDRQKGLQIAENARKALAEWPRAHFGYRQAEVREIVSLLDEAISELRASLGITSFDLAFVASAVDDPPLVALLDAPTLSQQMAQVFTVAALTERASDRIGLLQAALALLNDAGSSIPQAEARRWRDDVEGRIQREVTIDAAYANLSKRLMNSTTRAAAAANIPAVEKALEELRRRDDKMGRSRPEAVEALRTSIQSQLEAARSLRLRRDQWVVRRALYKDYERSVGSHLRVMVQVQPSLEAIRRLDGPSPASLNSLHDRLDGGADRLVRIATGVPRELRDAHDLLVNAWRFAERAVRARSEAVSSGNLATAWEASSAAAGALLMLGRAQQDISELLEPPTLQ